MDRDEYAYGLSAAEVLSVCVAGLTCVTSIFCICICIFVFCATCPAWGRSPRAAASGTRLNDMVIPTHNDMVISNTTMGK